MELTLTEEDAAHWVYKGEGAVNLVLAYTGSSPSYVRPFFFFFGPDWMQKLNLLCYGEKIHGRSAYEKVYRNMQIHHHHHHHHHHLILLLVTCIVLYNVCRLGK